jgi:hypothetical protein
VGAIGQAQPRGDRGGARQSRPAHGAGMLLEDWWLGD